MGQGSVAVLPFHTFLWKVASRCNLNCSYCYVYNSADQRWRRQPKLMSAAVARQTALRMREHLLRHGQRQATVSFHGGEPLLGGVRHLEMLCGVLDEAFAGTGIEVSRIMQSNGLLFTPEIGDCLLRHRIKMGVSLDGPPEVNDRYRVDHDGRPTSARLEAKLELLLSPRYAAAYAGILCVIDLSSDPVAVIEYLLSLRPRSMSLLFPLNNHEQRPAGKEHDLAATPYGDWLIACFDVWWRHAASVRVAIFDSILSLLCGGPTCTEAIGLAPVALIAVETNGEIEGLDALKSTFEGATELGLDVFRHDFDTAARHPAVQQRQIGLEALCQSCRQCPVVEICGGGYLPHRYSAERGFANPSVYSSDLKKLIRHIDGALRRTLEAEQTLAVAV
jgi:uncharacterized protein